MDNVLELDLGVFLLFTFPDIEFHLRGVERRDGIDEEEA